MGKFDKLAKFFGKAIEDAKGALSVVDDEAKALRTLENPEVRKEYLSALDEVQGPKDTRILEHFKDPIKVYHGSSNIKPGTLPISEEDKLLDYIQKNTKLIDEPRMSGRSMNASENNAGFFVTTSPYKASQYAKPSYLEEAKRIEENEIGGQLYPMLMDRRKILPTRPGASKYGYSDEFDKVSDIKKYGNPERVLVSNSQNQDKITKLFDKYQKKAQELQNARTGSAQAEASFTRVMSRYENELQKELKEILGEKGASQYFRNYDNHIIDDSGFLNENAVNKIIEKSKKTPPEDFRDLFKFEDIAKDNPNLSAVGFDGQIKIVKPDSGLRSTNAAFDTRFKTGKNIMLGGAAIPAAMESENKKDTNSKSETTLSDILNRITATEINPGDEDVFRETPRNKLAEFLHANWMKQSVADEKEQNKTRAEDMAMGALLAGPQAAGLGAEFAAAKGLKNIGKATPVLDKARKVLPETNIGPELEAMMEKLRPKTNLRSGLETLGAELKDSSRMTPRNLKKTPEELADAIKSLEPKNLGSEKIQDPALKSSLDNLMSKGNIDEGTVMYFPELMKALKNK